MAEWGRKQYAKPWPSRAHVWTWGAFFLSCLFFVFMTWRGRASELDGGGAAVPVGLPEERRAGEASGSEGASTRCSKAVTAKGEQAARDRRRDRGGEGPGRAATGTC